MLIRSQNKEFLINTNNSFVIEVVGIEGDFKVVCSDQCNDYSVGCYSTKEKALKVLDMIQEAYGDSECTKFLIPEICNILRVAERTEENKEHARKIGEGLKDGMTFQMPADSEVEA